MRDNISTLTTNTIQIGLVIVAFFIPLFFLTTTSEFYNFNKTTLLIIASFFLFFVWGVKMVAEKRVNITRTPLDIPILVFLAVYIVASLFSIDPVVSILGWHPTFFGSLPSIAALVILYFLATTHLNSTYRQAVLIAFIASASLLSLAFMASYFGHPIINASWAKVRSWTPASDLNVLVSFLAIAIPVTISYALFTKEQIAKYFVYAMVGLQIIAFALINNFFGYIVLASSTLFVLLFIPRLSLKNEERISLGILVGLVALIAILVNVKPIGQPILKPLISGDNKDINISKPVRLPLSAAWQTSAQAVANRPIFGSGPATYAMIFPSFKPISLNSSNDDNLWNVRFDSPSSGLLNILATTGAAGIIAFLLIVVLLVRSLIGFSAGSEIARQNAWFVFLQAGLISTLVGFIFFEITPATGVAFMLLAAAFYSTLRDLGSNMAGEVNLQLVALRSGAIKTVDPASRNSGSDALAWAFMIPATALLAAILFYVWGNYTAEFYYQKAVTSSQKNQGKDTRDNLVAAIKANPYRDTYHRALLVTDLALARALNQKGELSDQEQQTLLALVREGIDQGRIITGYEGRGIGSFQVKRVSGSSPLNVSNWESIATVYSNIGGQLRNDASVHAINTFSQAIRLDPTNPRLYEALGNVYFALGDNDNAIKQFELAVSVKPDYASAHYNLAVSVRKKGDNPARVVNELSAALQLLPDNEANKASKALIQKELDEATVILKKTTVVTPEKTATSSATKK